MDILSSSDLEPRLSAWAFLPEELLDLILDRLIQLCDYLRFAAVCKPWLATALRQKDKRRGEVHKQVPMLLVPTKDRSHKRRSLYSVTQNKVLNLQLKVPYSRRFCGSSYGWLANVEEDMSIKLLNPFSGKTIRFPPVAQRPNAKFFTKRRPFNQEHTVPRVILSCDPSLMPNDFVALAIYSTHNTLAYIKPGHDRWTYLDDLGDLFGDAIYHRGKFYAVDYYCRVIAIDISGDKEAEVTVVVPRSEKYAHYAYIVESSSGGDLLLIQRFFGDNSHFNRSMTLRFKIFKLLGLGGGEKVPERVRIKNLGDDALFLGDNYSISVSASNFPGCQPNCIYYTDDFIDHGYDKPSGPVDTGIYCFEDGSFAQHYQLKARHRRMPPLIWIVPGL